MTGTDLARTATNAAAAYQPEAALPAAVQEWRMICEQAEILSKAGDVVPRSFQGQPAKIIAAGLAGQPFGWNVMTSMRMGHVIGGGYRLNAEAQAALIRQGGHRLTIDRVGDDGRCVTVTGERAGEVYTAVWTDKRAAGMGLWDKWDKAGTTDYMLVWRAVAEVARFLFPDLMYGMAYAEGEKPDLDAADTVEPELPLDPLDAVYDKIVALEAADAVVEPEIVNLFGVPGEAPQGVVWADWGRPEWQDFLKRSGLGLPEISRTWKLRNYDDVANADEATRAAIYDAARSAEG